MQSVHTMRPIAIDGVMWSVCLLFTFVSPAKTAGPIKMSFWGLTQVGPRYHVSDGDRDPLWEWAILGVVWPLKALGVSAVML